MPDEAIYGVRALGLWQHGSLPLFGSSGRRLQRALPGVRRRPAVDRQPGDRLRDPQARPGARHVARRLAGLRYTRRLVPEGYALLAAALTLACPLVLFSGFVMTEVLYYPLAAAALLAIGARGRHRDAQGPGDRTRADRGGSRDARAGRRLLARLRRRAARRRGARPTVAGRSPLLARLVARRCGRARRRAASRRLRRIRGGGQRELQRRPRGAARPTTTSAS